MGILFISLSILAFGLSNCLWVYPLRQFSFLQAIVLRSCLSALLFGCFLLLQSAGLVMTSYGGAVALSQWMDYATAIVLCVFSFFGLYFYVQSLKEEQVSLAVPISSISGLFGILTGVLFFGEPLSLKFGIASIIIFVGVTIADNQKRSGLKFSTGVWFNLLAAFFWGVSFALFAASVKSIGPIQFSFILETTVLICSVIMLKRETLRHTISFKHLTNKYILALGILGFAGVLFYNTALLYLPVTIASLSGVLTPIISLVIAALLLKERLTARQYIGILIVIIGLALIKI